jgi:hypothetical protein
MIELLEHLIKDNEEDFEDLLKPASDEEREERLKHNREMAIQSMKAGKFPSDDITENELYEVCLNEFSIMLDKMQAEIMDEYGLTEEESRDVILTKDFGLLISRCWYRIYDK